MHESDPSATGPTQTDEATQTAAQASAEALTTELEEISDPELFALLRVAVVILGQTGHTALANAIREIEHRYIKVSGTLSAADAQVRAADLQKNIADYSLADENSRQE